MLTVGQCGQPLNVYSEQVGERRGFRLAQLRELRSDLLHRAVPLAELLPGVTGVAGGPGSTGMAGGPGVTGVPVIE